MKIIYLLPPSEGKNNGWKRWEEKCSFLFLKPRDIAINVSPKDLKCTGKRYEEGVELNKELCKIIPPIWYDRANPEDFLVEVLSSISRYSWVMYNAINYAGMSNNSKKYFDSNFLILSGMYGLLRPLDMIGNYKLPIESKGLYAFWNSKITDTLNSLGADIIVDLLPNSYKKMISWKDITSQIVKIDFYNGNKKLTHGVKKVKGEFIHNICNKSYTSLKDFPGKKIKISENEYHISIIM